MGKFHAENLTRPAPRRYAIDDGTDFTEAQAHVEALNKADPSRRQGMSTVVSVKAAKPAPTSDKSNKTAAAGKRKAVEASGKDGKNKKPKKKA
jgi:hypothetical protein